MRDSNVENTVTVVERVAANNRSRPSELVALQLSARGHANVPPGAPVKRLNRATQAS